MSERRKRKNYPKTCIDSIIFYKMKYKFYIVIITIVVIILAYKRDRGMTAIKGEKKADENIKLRNKRETDRTKDEDESYVDI